MHVLQIVPVLRSAAPAQRLGERVTRGTSVLHVIVRKLLIEQRTLDEVLDWLRLFRREPVSIAEITKHLARFIRLHLQTVQTNHAFDSLFPALRRRTNG